MNPRELLTAFDRYLTEHELRFEAIVIGGTALNLLGVVSRPTKDCEFLYPKIPEEIARASRAFAAQIRGADVVQHDWLNNGPATLVDHLPFGWQERVQDAFDGVALHLRCLGRQDLLCAKLFALCDRGIDLDDCVALAPSPEELVAVQVWLEPQDGNPHWPAHVQNTLADVARRLGYAI